ncbi:MAG: hypothetical protein IH588_04075 [Anaerolineales bacterium]|nr:hypothetical protein [Anaerolineales bacterium]
MLESNDNRTGFLATYFDRDAAIKIARAAGVFAWIVLGVYIFTTAISLSQFLMQFVTGIFFQKGQTIIDVVSYFNPYFIQLVPGFVYFIGLKFAEHGLLILLDIEDNTRRAARNGK